MSDLERGLKEAVSTATLHQRERLNLVPDDPFKAVRLRTRGALVSAHHDMKPRDGWAESDEIIWDMVTAWIDSLGGRR